MNYSDVYFKRLNRYGLNYQERIQNEREKNFDLYLLKTIYRVDFIYNGVSYAGSLEKNKQDESETKQYLLTKIDTILPGGTIIQITKDEEINYWMIYYLENIQASGYNRYIVLKMSHYLTWIGEDKQSHSSYAYLYGQQDNELKDELKSRARNNAVYNEAVKSSFFVLPKNQYIKKDVYLETGDEGFKQFFIVTGYDLLSTEGVEYVTIDPVYKYDLSAKPEKQSGESDTDYYWFGGST